MRYQAAIEVEIWKIVSFWHDLSLLWGNCLNELTLSFALFFLQTLPIRDRYILMFCIVKSNISCARLMVYLYFNSYCNSTYLCFNLWCIKLVSTKILSKLLVNGEIKPTSISVFYGFNIYHLKYTLSII